MVCAVNTFMHFVVQVLFLLINVVLVILYYSMICVMLIT
jgi:hypothetical protein